MNQDHQELLTLIENQESLRIGTLEWESEWSIDTTRKEHKDWVVLTINNIDLRLYSDVEDFGDLRENLELFLEKIEEYRKKSQSETSDAISQESKVRDFIEMLPESTKRIHLALHIFRVKVALLWKGINGFKVINREEEDFQELLLISIKKRILSELKSWKSQFEESMESSTSSEIPRIIHLFWECVESLSLAIKSDENRLNSAQRSLSAILWR